MKYESITEMEREALLTILPIVTEIIFKEDFKGSRVDEKETAERAGYLAAIVAKSAARNIFKVSL